MSASHQTVLIDAIVRQTTILLSALATASGTRAPLAHVANQVFTDLVQSLKQAGLGNKVIADMFGLTLRTYHAKVARLAESRTDRGHILWSAVLTYIAEQGPLQRAQILNRFRHDDQALVKGVLHDLVASSLVYRSGRGELITYRAVDESEMRSAAPVRDDDALANMLVVSLARGGPANLDQLVERIPLEPGHAHGLLETLVAQGRIGRTDDGRYSCDGFLLDFHDRTGWEAAVFDHYSAMVTSLCVKLRGQTVEARRDDALGGSTYGFDVWSGHPHEAEALGFLSEVRTRAVALRSKVDGYNSAHPQPAGAIERRVIAYVGQTVIEDETDEREGEA